MKNFLLLTLIFSLLLSCKKEPVKEEPASGQTGFTSSKGVFIMNEGNFTFGNAKVSYYNFSSGTVTSDIFGSANGRPLGDVCQSMQVINGKGYIVVNNSGKIEIVNMNDFKSSATITGFTSPRYIVQVSLSKAYVTDFTAGAIKIVDLVSGQINGSISCPGWTEQLLKSGDNVYVTNYDKGKVYVINSLNDLVIDSIPLVKGANSIVKDANGKIWVLCSGEASSGTNGALFKIDPSSNSIENTFPFPVTESPWRLTKNTQSDTLYYLNNGVNKMWTGSVSLPSSPFIASGSRNFYGLGINPVNSDIYVADAIDYVQSGRVYIYNSAGGLRSDFLAGIIPGDFYFY
jgi:DNA-binding beta-propeller fold protein YncE